MPTQTKPKQSKVKTQKELKVTKKNIDKFIINGEKLVYIPTGEVIDNIFTIYDFFNICQDCEKSEKIPKDFYYNNWQNKKKFTKLYQVEIREINDKLSLQAKGLLFVFMINLKQSTNEVMINGKRPTNEILLKQTDIGIKLLNKLFSELEDAKLIKRVGNTNKRMILLNPYLCFNGSNLIKKTLIAFYPDHK